MRLSFHVLYLAPALLSTPSSPQEHPLDPLTPSEPELACSLVANSIFPTTNDTKLSFQYVGLHEPDKPAIYSWLSNQTAAAPLPRQAFVVALIDRRIREIVVDVSANSIVSDRVYTGHGYSTQTNDEVSAAEELPLRYAPFVESANKRGLNISDIVCLSYSMGWFGEPATAGRTTRLVGYNAEGTPNFHMRPLEGIAIVANFDEMRIVQYKDRLVVPIPKAEGTDYRSQNRKKMNGVAVEQPEMARSFETNGNMVSWKNWIFHVGFDVRAGPVISLVSIFDQEVRKHRRIIYRGFISKVFVPYMDLSEEWYNRNTFNAGDYGMGQQAVPLVPSADCPAGAAFFDGYCASSDGTPVKVPNLSCVCERRSGDLMWRHSEEATPDQTVREVRPEVSLVVRMVSTVGDYDHVLVWEFKPTGSINVKVNFLMISIWEKVIRCL